MKGIIILFSIILTLSSCDIDQYKINDLTIEEKLAEAGIEFSNVITFEERNNNMDIIVFYELDTKVTAQLISLVDHYSWEAFRLMQLSETGWEYFSWNFKHFRNDDKKIEHQVFLGLIVNDKVKKMVINDREKSYTSTIIKTENDNTFYYYIRDSADNTEYLFDIQYIAYDENDNELFGIPSIDKH